MKRTMLIVAIALMVGSVYGAWSYSSGQAIADSYGDGPPPTLPTLNPNGQFMFVDGAGGLLIPGTDGWNGQVGWIADDGAGGGFYAQVLNPGLWGTTLPIMGHSPARQLFIVPAFEDAGSDGVLLEGFLEQPWEVTRLQQITVNGQIVATVASPGDASGPMGTGSLYLPCAPGDFLDIQIGPAIGHPDQASTWTAWDLQITEVTIPEPMTMALLGLGSLVALRKRR
jgi:hypothetical protein